jgi:isochorismate synthase
VYTQSIASTQIQCSPALLWQVLQQQVLPAAFWRQPHQQALHCIVSFTAPDSSADALVQPGFVINPFSKALPFRHLPSHLHLVWEKNSLTDLSSPAYSLQKENLMEKAASFFSSDLSKNSESKKLIVTTENTFGKQAFTAGVKQALKAIRQDVFRKVVLSRTKEVALGEEFDPLWAFERLCQAYPHAFVSLVFLAGEGIWLGASPELLVSQDSQGIMRTMSLAGTQRLEPGMQLSQARWSQKEIEEQALVSRYIVNAFKQIRLREYEEKGPRTVMAGNLLHLRTDFRVDTQAVHFPDLWQVMRDLLHPTSAVCGMPKPEALAFIEQWERHDRGYYSGYLGPVELQGETALYVNLRCLQLPWLEGKPLGNGRLYAGAGINLGSEAEREWQETEWKCQTLLNVFS